jgi:hypothetical protein
MNTGKMGTKLMGISDLEKIYNASTQGEWRWNIEDSSMATLGVGLYPGMGDPMVMSVSPCRSCESRTAEWQWGLCGVPSKADADCIVALHNAFPRMLRDYRDWRSAARAEADEVDRRGAEMKELRAEIARLRDENAALKF